MFVGCRSAVLPGGCYETYWLLGSWKAKGETHFQVGKHEDALAYSQEGPRTTVRIRGLNPHTTALAVWCKESFPNMHGNGTEFGALKTRVLSILESGPAAGGISLRAIFGLRCRVQRRSLDLSRPVRVLRVLPPYNTKYVKLTLA
jgi:hypothetical protein